jgi:septal ring factor EnvC (AmiA/AmiB activator)
MKSISRSSWKPYSNFALSLAALLVFLGSPTFAQTQEPSTSTPASEVEQLKKRLQQLEQTVVELKGQIGAIEAKKQSPTRQLSKRHTRNQRLLQPQNRLPIHPPNRTRKVRALLRFTGLPCSMPGTSSSKTIRTGLT